MRCLTFALLLMACSFQSGRGLAADNMSFSGTLVEPPLCTINSGVQIDVDFGNRVGIGKIDGTRYLETINYQVTCAPDARTWELSLTVAGDATVFDSAAVQTDIPDLGIRILKNGQPLPLNQRVVVDPAALPTLQAVPVKAAAAVLTEGAFEAIATLRADYQ